MDTDRRSFSVNTEKYYINQPTAANIRSSDLNYSKVYSKSLIEDIYTASEMRDILKRRGIIGPEYDKRAQELADMLEAAITDMYTATDDEKRKLAAEKASEIRNEIFQWNHRLNGPMSNTCEQIADDAKLEFLTSCIIVSDKDVLVWKDHDQFLNETNQVLQTRAKFEVMLYLQGLESDFLETVPEAVILKEIADKDIEEITKESESIENEEPVKEKEKVEETKVEELKVEKEVEVKKPVNEKKDNELKNKITNEKKKAKSVKTKK
ncbi:MAG: hypothetical protein JRJ00_00410 [Deltaproteobacteria bacterium]|nr:hypothetical protein [Deltaproteobacteria bacterium]